MWALFAFGSALLAGLTSILAKCGIRKTDSTLATAIRTVMKDEIYVSNALTPMMLSGFLSTEKEPGELSGREHEILKLLAEGYSNREIADMLAISVKTVETHRANIMRKHNFKNITELVLFAVRNHIIEP